jgi:hypothetical protein
MFDSLGELKFTRMCHQLIQRVYSQQGYVPGPRKGKDGGVDARYIKQEVGQPVTQFKFREVAGRDDTKLRQAIVREFEKWLTEVCAPTDTGTFLFITNVRRTGTDQKTITDIAANYLAARIEYWDFERLSDLMDAYPDLADDCLKVWNAEELRKKQNDLERREAEHAAKQLEIDRNTPAFVNVSLKFKMQFIDWALLATNYHAFIYLIEPVSAEPQDEVRRTVRALFQINEEAEQKVIDILTADGRLDITGDIISTNEPEQARAAAAAMMQHMGMDLEKVLTLIQEAKL